MTQEQYRQGDVLLVRVKQKPRQMKLVERDKGRIILAYGEVTGHAHAITESWAKLFESADQRFLELPQEATLVHEEHSTITIAPGTYRVVRQREYVSADMPPIAVAD